MKHFLAGVMMCYRWRNWVNLGVWWACGIREWCSGDEAGGGWGVWRWVKWCVTVAKFEWKGHFMRGNAGKHFGGGSGSHWLGCRGGVLRDVLRGVGGGLTGDLWRCILAVKRETRHAT